MDEIERQLAERRLVRDVRAILERGADRHLEWLQANLRSALLAAGHGPVAIAALTGLAPNTVRGFLAGRPSSIRNVLLMAGAAGVSLSDLDRPPERFAALIAIAGREPGQESMPPIGLPPSGLPQSGLPQSDLAQPDEARQGAAASAVSGDIPMVEGTTGLPELGPLFLAFEASPVAMALSTTGGVILKANRALRDALGYRDGELIGGSVSDLLEGVEPPDVRIDLPDADSAPVAPVMLRRADGSQIAMRTSATLLRDASGEPRLVLRRMVPQGG